MFEDAERSMFQSQEPGSHHSPAVLPCNPLPGVKHLVCSNARATTAPFSTLVIESTWRKHKGQVAALTWYNLTPSRDQEYTERSKNRCPNKTITFFSRSLCNTHAHNPTEPQWIQFAVQYVNKTGKTLNKTNDRKQSKSAKTARHIFLHFHCFLYVFDCFVLETHSWMITMYCQSSDVNQDQ